MVIWMVRTALAGIITAIGWLGISQIDMGKDHAVMDTRVNTLYSMVEDMPPQSMKDDIKDIKSRGEKNHEEIIEIGKSLVRIEEKLK